jgi:hypothetical protein
LLTLSITSEPTVVSLSSISSSRIGCTPGSSLSCLGVCLCVCVCVCVCVGVCVWVCSTLGSTSSNPSTCLQHVIL